MPNRKYSFYFNLFKDITTVILTKCVHEINIFELASFSVAPKNLNFIDK